MSNSTPIPFVPCESITDVPEEGYIASLVVYKHYVLIPPPHDSAPPPIDFADKLDFCITVNTRQRLVRWNYIPTAYDDSALWLVNDEDQYTKVVISKCKGMVNDHLIFPCFTCPEFESASPTYEDATCGMLRIHCLFTPPVLDFTTINTDSNIEARLSRLWSTIPKQQNHLSFSLAFPPGTSSTSDIYYEVLTPMLIFRDEIQSWKENEEHLNQQAKLRGMTWGFELQDIAPNPLPTTRQLFRDRVINGTTRALISTCKMLREKLTHRSEY